MNIDAIAVSASSVTTKHSAAEQIDLKRKAAESDIESMDEASLGNEIQPEELLDKIKSITQDGLYSVRFEQFKDTEELVVQIFDNETKEVIRQIPPEELLMLELNLEELRGNLVSTKA